MCLAALAIAQNDRFPFVLAANRDEYFGRPTAPLDWWAPAPDAKPILGGRDLKDGGTWLGLTTAGRMALVTNIRRPAGMDPKAPSRGGIVPLWLRGDLAVERYCEQVANTGYNPFNLIAWDFELDDCFWASTDLVEPQRLQRGLYGLSNASLDTPWPKLTRLKARMRDALDGADSVQHLSARLFAALADRTLADDEALPATGIPLDWERALSPVFIRTPDGRYGTRCSTLVIAERQADGKLLTQVFERSFAAGDAPALQQRRTLGDWPPSRREITAA
jgi:uncharacterized protein with NRDE domain